MVRVGAHLLICLAVVCVGTTVAAQASSPGVERALRRSARQLESGRLERAAATLRRQARRTPGAPRVALGLSRALLPRDAEAAARSPAFNPHCEEARAALDAALEAEVDDDGTPEVTLSPLNPASPPPEGVGRRSLALERAWVVALCSAVDVAAEALAAQHPRLDRPVAELLREMAALAVRRGRLESASAALAFARRADATFDTVLFDQVAVWAARGELRAAVEPLRRALSLHPGDPRLRLALAKALLSEGVVDEALTLLRERARLCRDPRPCQRQIVDAALEARAFAGAVGLARELAASPDAEGPDYRRLGLTELGLQHLERARRAFERALQLSPSDARSRAALDALDTSGAR